MENSNIDSYIKTIGTPKDYSNGLYLVYIELFEANDTFREIISKHCKIRTELEFGYICEAHMQAIPEIARSLSLKNHAIYQMVRLGKVTTDEKNEL